MGESAQYGRGSRTMANASMSIDYMAVGRARRFDRGAMEASSAFTCPV